MPKNAGPRSRDAKGTLPATSGPCTFGRRTPSRPLSRIVRPSLFLLLGISTLAGANEQSAGLGAVAPQGEPRTSPRIMEWKEGSELRVRVPIATDKLEAMSTIAFPEDGIGAAVTGWAPSSITAVQKGGYLFLKLTKKSAGQLNVIGESGTHYLLYLEGVAPEDPAGYDSFVKITRPKQGAPAPAPLAKAKSGDRPKPKGALELMRAMRVGARPEGARILRAKGEVLLVHPEIEIRLLFVYEHAPYVGRIYDVRNLTSRKLALDASKFRALGETLVLSGLRENVVSAGGSTRFYTVFWKD